MKYTGYVTTLQPSEASGLVGQTCKQQRYKIIPNSILFLYEIFVASEKKEIVTQRSTERTVMPLYYLKPVDFCSFMYMFICLFIATPCSIQDLNSLTRDQTCAPCSGSMGS